MLNDPLANALSTIKNAETKGISTCMIRPSSKLIGGILSLLKEKGYVGNFEFIDDGKTGVFQLELVGSINNCGVIKSRYSVKRNQIEKFELYPKFSCEKVSVPQPKPKPEEPA